MALNYYDTTSVITTSQPVELDPESNLYQSEDVWKQYKRLSRKITVLNVGPGILYVRASHDGTYYSEEAVIYEGNSKDYDEIYVIKLRSPSANLRYRVTEYNVSTVSGQQFSGSRYKERRDRNGVVIFQDDFESPTLKYDGVFLAHNSSGNVISIALAPYPATIVRSTDASYFGDFSIRTIGGPIVNDASVLLYNHPDFHVGKVASQINFSTDFISFTVGFQIHYYDGEFQHQSVIYVVSTQDEHGNPCPAKLFLGTPDAPVGQKNLIEIATGLTLSRSIFSWNVLKLTIDISTFKYVAAFVNGERIDLSGFSLFKNTSIIIQPKRIDSIIENLTNYQKATSCDINQGTGNAPSVIYFDNYLFTEDETFN